MVCLQALDAFQQAKLRAELILAGYHLDAEAAVESLLRTVSDYRLVPSALQLGAAAAGNKLPVSLEPLLSGDSTMSPEAVLGMLHPNVGSQGRWKGAPQTMSCPLG